MINISICYCSQGQNAVFSLRLSDGRMGAFLVEPATASGSASVTLRLNSSLDYEDPNQRKFILEVSVATVSETRNLISSSFIRVYRMTLLATEISRQVA